MLSLLLSASSSSQELHKITAYSHGCTLNKNNPKEIRKKAANNEWPIYNITVAADWKLYPKDTELIIEGIGIWRVTDRSGSIKKGKYVNDGRIKGKRIDLFVGSCRFAKNWGVRYVAILYFQTLN